MAVRKPGNVSHASPGHGMQAAQFIASHRGARPATALRNCCTEQSARKKDTANARATAN